MKRSVLAIVGCLALGVVLLQVSIGQGQGEGATSPQPNVVAPGGGLGGGLRGAARPGPDGKGPSGVGLGAAPQESVPTQAGVEQVGRYQVATAAAANQAALIVVIDSVTGRCWTRPTHGGAWADLGIPPMPSTTARDDRPIKDEKLKKLKNQLSDLDEQIEEVENAFKVTGVFNPIQQRLLKQRLVVENKIIERWDELSKKPSERDTP